MSEILSTVPVYDPEKVIISINSTVITGFSPDSVIVVTPNADAVSLVVGVQGDASYTKSADRSAMATIQLMQTSASLPMLRSLAARDAEVRLSVTDSNERDSVKIDAENCRIQRMPDVGRKKEQESIDVVIIIPRLELR